MSTTRVAPVNVEIARRPYILTFEHGRSYPISSEEVRRLIDNYPITRFRRNELCLRGDGDPGIRSRIAPATLGGGDAFTRVTQ